MEGIKNCSEENEDYIHRRLQEYNSRYITVDYLFVDDAYRKNGYGSKLLTYLETQAIGLGVKRIILNTFGFQAPVFYEKQGYQLFGKIEPCFSDYGQYFFKKEL